MHIFNPQKLPINLIYPANMIFTLLKAICFRKCLLVVEVCLMQYELWQYGKRNCLLALLDSYFYFASLCTQYICVDFVCI